MSTELPEPDPDTIKMFVGQIPRNWNEAECRELFEEFGPVHQLNVLRNKTTQASQGCCFVTFYHRQDAITAQDKLHNIRVLPNMSHAIQMKPADMENRNERKLFVGMLNKSMTEDDVRKMFKEFGSIEECTVLREEGKSRGCAFVTYSTRLNAQQAIRQMHQSVTLEGCSKPIVVKFADTQRDKKQNGTTANGTESVDQSALLAQFVQQQKNGSSPNNVLTSQLMGLNTLLQQPGILNLIGTIVSSLTASSSSSSQTLNSQASTSQLTSKQQSQLSGSPSDDNSVPNAQQLQLNALLQHQKMAELLRTQNKDSNFNITSSGLYLPAQNQQLVAGNASFSGISLSPPAANVLSGFNNIQSAHLSQQQAAVLNPNQAYDEVLLGSKNAGTLSSFAQQFAATIPSQLDAYNNATQSPQPVTQFGQQLSLNSNSLNLLAQQRALAAAASSLGSSNNQSKGPEGCNIFIYHLPQEFQDTDLYQLFIPFGNIISANVFIDKQTNLSKCFGFVSYDNAVSAQNAISAMNGFQVHSKRLKVQLKQSKSKPYQQSSNSKQANANFAAATIQQ
ncbi:hypothetical protein M3Y97_00535300 [Aphelenchoides bicaudatus]|nr:hypothetical protein M3Y97_00535300 [Aphelenchoides bicaudatus]